MKSPKNYITNKKFYEAIVEYKQKLAEATEAGRQKPQVTNYIGESILLICNKLSTKGNFSGYSPQWKQEMISDGVMDCIAAVDNFDPNKTNNPFAYFTMIAWNAFIRRITKEKRQTYIKHKNFENSFLMNDQWSDAENNQLKANEYSSEIVKSFEEKLTKTKKDAKLKGIEKFVGDDNEE
jgi:DNA-directed RNA polymerase specialized sigma subunit